MANEIKTCKTCGKDAYNPYRVIANGEIVEGCVSDFHTGCLYGNSKAWHNRLESKKIRENTAKALKRILA